MLFHYRGDLALRRGIPAELNEGGGEVLSSYSLVAVAVKLLEERLELLLGDVFLDGERGREELRVVDGAVLLVVNLVDDLVDLLRSDVDALAALHDLLQLAAVDNARAVLVDDLKLGVEAAVFVRVDLLHEDI